MLSQRRLVLRGLAIWIVLSSPVLGAKITIDEQKEYQTIEGLGCFGSMEKWWSGGPFYNDAFLNDVIGDLGLTMSRQEVYPDFNGSVSGQMAKMIPFYKAMKAKAEQKGEPLKFITSIWTPPARFKTNNSEVQGGHVRTSAYGAFADYLVQYIKRRFSTVEWP